MITNWQYICKIVQESMNDKEETVQKKWTMILSELLGWSTLKNEIQTQRVIQMGSLGRMIPDIIVNDGTKDLFILELKQHNLPKSTSFVEQLRSYMRILKINLGILVCDKLYFYYTNPKTGIDDIIEFAEINFLSEEKNYQVLFDLLSKKNFDEQKISDYAENSIKKQQDVIRIEKRLTNDFFKTAIKEKLKLEFDSILIDETLNLYSFSVTRSISKPLDDNVQDGKLISIPKPNPGYGRITQEMVEAIWQYFLKLIKLKLKIGLLADEVSYKTGMNRGSAFIYLGILKNLTEGKLNKRSMKHTDLKYYLKRVKLELPSDYWNNAIQSIRKSIPYWRGNNLGYAIESENILNELLK